MTQDVLTDFCLLPSLPRDVRPTCRPAARGATSAACPRRGGSGVREDPSLLARGPPCMVRPSGGAVRNQEHNQPEDVLRSCSCGPLKRVCDIILHPPEENAYSTLKDLLIKRTAASERKRLQLLFTSEELGDRKPTQLLRSMQQLLGDSAGPLLDNSLIRELFFQRLPSHVRMVLASSGDAVSLDTLADMADKMMEVAQPNVTSITSTSAPTLPPPPPSPASSDVTQLRAEISELRQLISSLQLSSSRSTSQHRSRSQSRSSSPHPNSGLCWYHRRFEDKANKCTSPCTWQGNGQA